VLNTGSMKHSGFRAPLLFLLLAACSPASVKPIDRGIGAVPMRDASAPRDGSGAGATGGAGGTGGPSGTAGAAARPVDARRPDLASPPPAPPPPPVRPPPPDAAPPPDAGLANKTILFVTGSMGMILSDMTMVDRMSGRGFMVTVRTDTAVRATDAQGKGAVLLSGSTSLANIMTNLAQAPDLEVPLLAMDENLEPFLNLTAAPDTDHGTTNGTQVAILNNADDDLTGGLEGTVTIFNVEFNISWGVPGPEAERVATVVGNDDEVAMFVYDEGDEMANDEEAPAKRAFFFVRDSPTANLMTEDALKLFDAIVDFLVDP
jgi:hypothetical protein